MNLRDGESDQGYKALSAIEEDPNLDITHGGSQPLVIPILAFLDTR